MYTNRKLVQFAAAAVLIASIPAHAQVLGGALGGGGNLGGAVGGGLGSISGNGSASGMGQGTLDASGPVGGLRNAGDRIGNRTRDTAGAVKDKAQAGVDKARTAGSGTVDAGAALSANAAKQAESTSAPAPTAPSGGLLGSTDGSAATSGDLSGGIDKTVMGKQVAADGASSHSAQADRSGIAASKSQQANVKAGPREVATPAPEAAPAN